MIKIKMKRDGIHTNTVVESLLADKPEKDRFGFIIDWDERGFFWAYFPILDYECAIFRNEFNLIK